MLVRVLSPCSHAAPCDSNCESSFRVLEAFNLGTRRLRVAEGQVFEPLDVAKVSPFIVENHEAAGFQLILWLLPNSVVCEDF